MTEKTMNLRGLKCPLPALRVRKMLSSLKSGDLIVAECTDPLASIDIPNLLRQTGDTLEGKAGADGVLTFRISQSVSHGARPATRKFRLHHRRRRLRRLRAGQSPHRLGPPSRAAAGSRRPRPQHLDSHPARLRQAVRQRRKSTGSTRRSPSLSSTTAKSSSRAAKCWAARARSTACSISAASTKISTIGGNSAMPAGALTMCCPISGSAEDQERGADDAAWRGRPARRLQCQRAASIVRSLHRRRPRRPAFRATTISTAPRQEGAGYFQLTAQATAGAARPRSAICGRRGGGPILKSATDALATRILFSGRRAIGVEYRQGDTLRTAHANAEVIVAGGAFNSPQLLQLSGIGPAEPAARARHRR